MRVLLHLLLLALLNSSIQSFTATGPLVGHSRARLLVLGSSAPSDSASSEDENADAYGRYGYGTSSASSPSTTVDTSSTPYEPTSGEAMVTNVMDLLTGKKFTDEDLSPQQRASIQEALYQLEAVNPTPRPAVSPLLNGVWELKYVGGYTTDFAVASPTRQLALFLYSGGYSPGVFAYTVAQRLPSAFVDLQSSSSDSSSLEICITRAPQPRIEASVGVKLFGGAVEGKVAVKARLEVESDMRLRETYESVNLVFGGQQQSSSSSSSSSTSTSLEKQQIQPLNIPPPLQYARDLFVTYLDEDLLVVRDGSGVPEVLIRKQKQFQRNWGTEPSAIDDMLPPGDGQDAQF